MTILHNGSFWFDSLGEIKPGESGPLPNAVDVAIIGAGYTGLWSAYYLKQLQPELDIAVFESNTVGFGASGRNGGWCMGWAFGIDEMLANKKTRGKGFEVVHAMQDTVDEIGRVAQAENIDCHFEKGGTLTVATTKYRIREMQERVAWLHSIGFTEEDFLLATEGNLPKASGDAAKPGRCVYTALCCHSSCTPCAWPCGSSARKRCPNI